MAEKTFIDEESILPKQDKTALALMDYLAIIFGLIIYMAIFGIYEAIRGYELNSLWPVVVTVITAPYLKNVLRELIAKLF
ncbi:MAG: hypothetical protein WC460_03395 [Patescibacteria group bacterium]